MISNRLLIVVSKQLLTIYFLLFWCFACEQWESNTTCHAIHRITPTFLTQYSSFSISLLFYDAFFLVKSNLYYAFFYFLSSFYHDTILSIIVHWVERVCTNHTPVPNGPFAYDVVYATLPSIQPSFIHTMGCCGLEEVYVNTIDATLFSIEPSLSRFYRMCSSWWGACRLP